MTIGLDLVAAYENGLIYSREVLAVDEKAFMNSLNMAAAQGLNLAVNVVWTTKDTMPILIAKSFREAKAVGLEFNVIDSGIIDDLLAKAERSMLSVKDSAGL